MSGFFFSTDSKLVHIASPAAPDATDLLASATDLDTTGYAGTVYLLSVGAVGTSIVVTPQVADNAAFTGSSARDLRQQDGTSAALTIGTSGADTVYALHIVNPPDRFVGINVNKTGNCAVAIAAIQYRAGAVPIANATVLDILNGVKHSSLT